jgi:hypothetical protein
MLMPEIKWKWEVGIIPVLTFGFTLTTALVTGVIAWGTMQSSVAAVGARVAGIEVKQKEMDKDADERSWKAMKDREIQIETLTELKTDMKYLRIAVDRLTGPRMPATLPPGLQ